MYIFFEIVNKRELLYTFRIRITKLFYIFFNLKHTSNNTCINNVKLSTQKIKKRSYENVVNFYNYYQHENSSSITNILYT